MTKKISALLLALVLCLGLLAACGNDSEYLTDDDAIKIVLEDIGLKKNQVEDIHAHVSEQNGVPCFEIHVDAGSKEYTYYISAIDGEILSKK